MPTVTAAPISPLARLRAKIAPLPPPTAKDRARWRKIAADRSPVLVTDDAPDVGIPTPGLIECAPPASYLIDDRVAEWFDAHGGTRTVLRALRQYMRAHDKGRSSRSTKPARRSSAH